ncbi:hypothetical protein V8C86DRAFT_2808321 [Haematococcus lacustris]
MNTITLETALTGAQGQVAQAQSRIAELEVEANAARTNASTLQTALSGADGAGTSGNTQTTEPGIPPPRDVDKKLTKMTKDALIGTLVDAGIVEQGATPRQMWLSIAEHFLPKDKAVLSACTIAGLQQRLRSANCITVAADTRDRWEELVRKAWKKNNDDINFAVRCQSWVLTRHTKDEIRDLLKKEGYEDWVAAYGEHATREMWRTLANDLLRPQYAA